MRICQLQKIIPGLLFAIFFASCATSKIVSRHDERVINAGWFKTSTKFTHLDKDDNFLTHPFFDIDPEFKKDRRTINYFITTPEDSAYKYNFDLLSGKLYKDRNYCAGDDIWDSYKGEIYKPSFTQGIVPRINDQSLKPQRIIIFSSKEEIEKFKYLPTNFDSARVVGSVILEACENFPCDSKAKWTSSQILVAVNYRDPKYANINFINELKGIVDWNYVKAILVNQDGTHQVGNKFYPAFRVSKEYNIDETLKYFETNSTAMQMDKMLVWRDSCYKLYDDIWESSEKIRLEKHNQQTAFLNFFREFYLKNSDFFNSCQKIIRTASINDNAKRVWYFAYLQTFINLEKNGFYYNCHDKSWFYNPRVDDSHFFNDQNKELQMCNPHNFEKSFDYAINGLSLMKNQINKSFRFVEYDTQRGGSHQKLYSWVADSGKNSSCKTEKDPIKENQFDLFPQDVVWPGFAPDDDSIIQ